MNEILYVDDDDDFRELATLKIEGTTELETYECKSVQAAIKFITETPSIQLIISDYDMPGGNGNQLYEYIKKTRPIPFILFTSKTLAQIDNFECFPATEKGEAYLQKPEGLKSLAETVLSVLNKSKENGMKEEKEEKKAEKPIEFCKIGIKKLLRFNSINSDIFIKMSTNKYLKIINKNELYDKQLIEKYQDKGIKYFHVKKEDFSSLFDYYAQAFGSILCKENITIEERMFSEGECLRLVGEILPYMGINEQVAKTINELINSNIKVIRGKPNIFELLSKMMNNRDYIYEHSILISYISGLVASKMSWNTENTLEKLSLAGLMHDISLVDEPTLAKIENIGEEKTKTMIIPKQHIALIRDHPQKISEMIRKANCFPPDIDQIIMEHHEMPDGSGFPKGLSSSKISPLASIFIISEKLVNSIYQKQINKELFEGIIDNIMVTYNYGNFRKIIEGLNKAVAETFKKP
ncbi:MAG: response regulator [Oligoflexia bacterium]|nr:response regulator [Oligoflexia bacterium]